VSKRRKSGNCCEKISARHRFHPLARGKLSVCNFVGSGIKAVGYQLLALGAALIVADCPKSIWEPSDVRPKFGASAGQRTGNFGSARVSP
jgi:hypothetical protein